MLRRYFLLCILGIAASAAPVCDISGVKAGSGLSASVASGSLEVTWDGDAGQEGQLRLDIDKGTPIVRSDRKSTRLNSSHT